MKERNHKLLMNIRILTTIITAAAGLFLNPGVRAAENPALMEPVKSVYEHYLKIQSELAKDSLKGVDAHANSIAKAVRSDEMKMLSPDVAKQAEALAKAKSLKVAREAFKPLSASLIKYLTDNNAGQNVYREAYCPMVKAGWLQSEKEIKNPYMGKKMLGCGEIRK